MTMIVMTLNQSLIACKHIFVFLFQNSSSSPAVTSTEKHRLSDQGSHTPTSSKRLKTENDKSARLVRVIGCHILIADVMLNALML